MNTGLSPSVQVNADPADPFDLDVRVTTDDASAHVGRGCDTSDGCGSTCASSCASS